MKVIKDERIHELTPELVAEMFAGFDASQQAAFFNEVGRIASTWSCGGIAMQAQYITEDAGLSLAGRRVMQDIGDYSHWGLTCRLTDETKRA